MLAIPVVFFTALAIISLCVYPLPYFIARYRRHGNAKAVGMLNFFLGWTFLGWVTAMVWSCTDNVREDLPKPLGFIPRGYAIFLICISITGIGVSEWVFHVHLFPHHQNAQTLSEAQVVTIPAPVPTPIPVSAPKVNDNDSNLYSSYGTDFRHVGIDWIRNDEEICAGHDQETLDGSYSYPEACKTHSRRRRESGSMVALQTSRMEC